jgi:hypothetical protein
LRPQTPSRLNAKTHLADASGADERDQPVHGDKRRDIRKMQFAADEMAYSCRQISGRRRIAEGRNLRGR